MEWEKNQIKSILLIRVQNIKMQGRTNKLFLEISHTYLLIEISYSYDREV